MVILRINIHLFANKYTFVVGQFIARRAKNVILILGFTINIHIHPTADSVCNRSIPAILWSFDTISELTSYE